ncbi:MAG: glycosyltransferase family 4 protein [Bacteroidota bacterium]
MSARPIRILIVYPSLTTFVQKDIDMLRSFAEVQEYHFKAAAGLGYVWKFMRQFFFLMGNIWDKDLVISEFAGYQSVVPALVVRIIGKPFLIISAGTDAASYPSFNYGNYRKAFYRFVTRFSFRRATHISPVHKSLMRSQNQFYPVESEKHQGINAHVPGLNKAFTAIPYGFDGERWTKGESVQANSFITVASIDDSSRYILKGVDLILAAADAFPDCHFTIIGMTYRPERSIPENVEVLPRVANPKLGAYFQRHEFYFQLSVSEGHPNALCESMLCGCIPIGSSVTSIPDIIGETGYVLEKREAAALIDILKMATTDLEKAKKSQAARQRILTQYPISRRQNELKALVEKMVEKS